MHNQGNIYLNLLPNIFYDTGGLIITKKADSKKYEISARNAVEKRTLWLEKIVPQRIKTSLLKSCVFPYATRAILDYYKWESLTFLQQKMIQPLLTGSS